MTAKQNTVANGDAVSRQPAVQFMKGDQGSNGKDEPHRLRTSRCKFTEWIGLKTVVSTRSQCRKESQMQPEIIC
eukprot:scaffold64256_cov37-Attheya_sp.AAC.2